MSCRIYLNQSIQIDSSIILPDALAHYLRQVMRQTIGDELLLFNGKGGEFHATIDEMSKQAVSCHINAFNDIDREMTCRVHIVQAACRNEKIEHVLQKGTELGAASFHITRSQRASLKLDSHKLAKRMERWQKIIIEAAEQSYRTAIPTLTWHDKLSDIPSLGSALAMHPHTTNSWQKFHHNIQLSSDITLAIGPEGGWSELDISSLSNAGFQTIAFGPRILRTETAAPALLAAIQAIRNDEL
ncbi:MAG: 16S rRNA (uracil(1498)-N(3))-methyltransferase [Mariprofundus sp.]|nr:16S rRNA (uracil(1498)-N(3))-methyltransferase [Mariprofundus sp.]